MFEFSCSSCRTFLDCRQKFKYSYIDLIAPRRKPWALVTGGAFHDGMEMINSGVKGKKVIQEIKKIYDDIHDTEEFGIDEERELVIQKNITVGMLLGYILTVRHDYEMMVPEKTVRLKLKNGRRVGMKVDGIVKKSGLYWLKEYKTTGSTDLERYKNKLEMNFQVDFYLSMVQRAIGKKLEGVLYEVIRKPLIRQRKDEELDDYVTRIRKDYLKRPKFYYTHKYVYRGAEQLAEFNHELEQLFGDIEEAIEENKFYKNKDNCDKYSGCIFKRLCFHSDESIRENLKQEYYREKEAVHEELDR